MDIQKLLGSVDDDILSQIIEACEAKMGEPLMKKPEAPTELPAEEPAEAASAAPQEGEMSDEELDELLAMQG